ncbi:hypothetical protein Pmani_033319 [Petrolisthes manimaculis]|uniref:Uncharacterized protein n=1 Tax=Petrolisthes manimaculis TaxID=1843537 RepID=A0AAE1NRA3_9EUCA|nr:hypothetical protein Pmani_033319 [Petrolisthes manimaculis]
MQSGSLLHHIHSTSTVSGSGINDDEGAVGVVHLLISGYTFPLGHGNQLLYSGRCVLLPLKIHILLQMAKTVLK